jgi:ABC-type nitrate/sulfonate/bicarbonate transport system permease component
MVNMPLTADGEAAVIVPRKMLRTRRTRLLMQIMLGIGFPCALLFVWELLAAIGTIDRRFFPAPSETFISMVGLLQNASARQRLIVDIMSTYQRLVIGYGIGATLGVVIGAAMALSAPIRFSLGPLINATFPTPKLAIFPLLIVIFGLDDPSKIVLVAIGVFYMTCLTTLSGVLYSNPLYQDVAHAFRIPAWTRWSRIVLPAAMPSIVTGLKLGLGQALILVVSAEIVSAQEGIGHFIWDSWQVLNVSRMFIGLIVVALTGGAAMLFGEILERRLVPWAA